MQQNGGFISEEPERKSVQLPRAKVQPVFMEIMTHRHLQRKFMKDTILDGEM